MQCIPHSYKLMLRIFLLCLARICCWQPVLPLTFRAFFRNVFYLTRKAVKNDGAADALQVTCACLGENGPFFGAFCMLSFALLLLAGSLAGFGAGSLAGFGAGSPEGGGSCSCKGLWPPPQTSLRMVKGWQERTWDFLDTNVPPIRKQLYMCFSLTERPFMGDIFLLMCFISPWRQHSTVIDKRPAIPVW